MTLGNKSQGEIELNTPHFSKEKFLLIQAETNSLVQKVFKKVAIGMNALDIESLILKEYHSFGFDRSWHPIKVRIDSDTLLSFSKKSDPKIRLQKNSVFFIDIGTVKGGIEGDVGRTFALGGNKEHDQLIKKCENIFFKTIDVWKRDGVTGCELYGFAQKKATELGVELNMNMDGHRLGSFPHGAFYKGSVAELDFSPSENAWILEIQIMCQRLGVGAFYEDLIK